MAIRCLRLLAPLGPGLLLALAACSPTATYVDDAALSNEAEPQDWLGYGRTYSEQRARPLRRVWTPVDRTGRLRSQGWGENHNRAARS